ncbi:MAG: glycosyl transferase family 1 [Pseudoalteromonas sp.]|nr:glycosyl transferase family 1 [Pseudoalteromonas sp.]|tara:strand:+ start:5615 stop:6754 length:1140 start_codon:yes stop_codon:yes gene_type:complete
MSGVVLDKANKVKVLHIITELGDGGAEGVLYRMCKRDKDAEHVVLTFINGGKYFSLLEDSGVKVLSLSIERGKFSLSAFWNLIKIIRANKPDVVQTWLYHPDLIGGVAARLCGVKSVCWGVRTSNVSEEKLSTKVITKVCALLSNLVPTAIICCAEAAVSAHRELGYSSKKLTLVRNGYDFSVFSDDALSASYQKCVSQVLKLGMVGRYTHQKDHNNLLESLHLLNKKHENWVCHLVGFGLTPQNEVLVNKINELNLQDKIKLDGQTNDVPGFMKTLDIHLLSSVMEGFPNVLAEAMASGVPCVSTDVGDASHIVGQTGWIVPPKNPEKFSNALSEAISELETKPQEWSQRCQLASNRVRDNFDVESMIKEFKRAWLCN